MTKQPWLSRYEPGDMVLVPHYGTYVKAKLIRQKLQPTGAWIVEKHFEDGRVTTSISNEFLAKKKWKEV